MSSPRGDPTDAPDYENLVVALSPGKRLGYDALRQVYLRLRPRRWSDRLTAEQRSLFHRVDSWGSWDEAREILDGELAEVKTLWLGAGGSGGGYLTRIYLGTYMGRACAVNVFRLRGDSGDPASAVPGDLRRWIGDEDVVKVVTDDAEELLSSPPYNLVFRCVVNAGDLYSKFRRMGVIRTPWECGGGRLQELLSTSLGYHHRPCTETEWERLVGESR